MLLCRGGAAGSARQQSPTELRGKGRRDLKLLHRKHYADALRQHLPAECFRPVPARLLWFIPHLLVVGVGAALVWHTELPLSIRLPLSLLMGVSFTSLGFLGHEILHGSVVASRRWQDVLGGLCFLPFAVGPLLWRHWHNRMHHGHTQMDLDPDAMGTVADYEHRRAVRWFYRLPPAVGGLLQFLSLGFWFSYHSLAMLLRYARRFRGRARALAVAQFALPVLLWTGLLLAAGPHRFAFIYLIPLLVANFGVMSYIATNHQLNPLTPVNDPLANSLTVRVPRWLDVLHLNFSHHVEHHIFPAMSPRHAPRVRALARRLWPERYQELPMGLALWTIWRTPRLYAGGTLLVDPRRRRAYPTLGHGLDPRRLAPQALPPLPPPAA